VQPDKPFEEIIAETPIGTIVAVYVKKFVCDSPISFEVTIKEKMAKHHKPFDYYTICYPIGKVPWPEPHVNRIYFFTPPNPVYVLSADAAHLIEDFDRVIATIGITPEEASKLYADQNQKVKEFFSKNSSEMPSTMSMAKNLLKQGWDTTRGLLEGKPIFVNDETQQKRLNICKTCDQFIDGRCKSCGCFMEQKTKLEAATCPISKW
jgi:hypothetical protein